MLPSNAMLLGFDFGLKKIGVACGQTITKTATPIGHIKAQAGVPKWEDINKLITTYQPDALIVGWPLNLDGTEQKLTQNVRDFAENLATYSQLPVFTSDERLTTVDAKSYIFEHGGYSSLKKADVDSIAACVILESWMRQHSGAT